MKKLAAFIPVLLFMACGGGDDNKKGPEDFDPVLSRVSNDTLIVSGNAAVFYEQDSITIEKQRKQNEADFTAGLEDYHMYLDSVQRFLATVKDKTASVDAKGQKFIKFIKSDNSSTLVKIDTIPTLWGLYLFTPTKEPEEVDMTDIKNSYEKYYR